MMDIITRVTDELLVPAALDLNDIEKVFASLMAKGGDYADLYFQSEFNEHWYLDDGIVKEGSLSIDKGVGVRVNSQEKTGFAYSDDIVLPALLEASQAASNIAQVGSHLPVKAWQRQNPVQLYSPDNPLSAFSSEKKVSMLQEIDAYARSIDPRVKQVTASLSGVYESILMINHLGELCADIRPLVRMGVQVIVEQGDRREQASSGGGQRGGYDYFISNGHVKSYTDEAVRQALVNLDARPAPAGLMPVVLGPGWPGVLLHEAVGHGLEGDFNRKKTSAFHDKMGQQVASSLCTIVDDGTLPNRRGSLSVDDEGVTTNCTTLIENGKLINYMQDRLNARLMKMAPTGNGRRESYAHIPMPRMTNTYMLPGQSTPEEIIRSVEKGIYAVNFSGGQVDITSGKFVFSASEAYLIEKGKVTAPIKGATLIGDGPSVLHKVSMVGNDLSLDDGVGVCGKDGQSVPVGVGQPTLKIDELTVGGTQSGARQ
jgi:TldD protein